MAVVFCRIDDRLIHGQVVTTWVNVHQVEQIIIVNEKVQNDKIQTSVLKMSAPPSITLHVFSPERFLRIIEKNPIKKRTMLLFSNVEDVEKIVDAGFHIEYLNVGGMRLEKERRQITKAVSINDDEKEIFEKLMSKGVKVEIQMVPSNEIVSMKEEIEKW